jgi:ribosomal protein L12E/L44/L45/RPP1/RPP2
MDILFAIAVVYGLAFALVRGTEHAGRAVRDTYVGHLAGSPRPATAGRPYASGRPASLGAKAGALVATGVTGLVMSGRGFAAGWREGWPEGRRRAYDRWGRSFGPSAEPAPGDGPQVDDSPPTPDPESGDPDFDALDREAWQDHRRRMPRLWAVPDSEPACAGPDTDVPASGGATTPTEDPEMAIHTTTGGEVLTMEQLIAELGTIIDEAAADLEDAQGDAQRAKEDAVRIDTMVASLRSMDLDEQTLSEVGALAEPAEARQHAAEQRAAAAEARHTQATAARDGVQSRHQLMAEAHAATPHAADKQFYTGG